MFDCILWVYSTTETITISQSTKRELICDYWYSSKKVHVIDDTIDQSNIPVPKTEKKLQIAYIGRISPIKQVEHTIQLLADLHTKWLLYHLYIIGKWRDEWYNDKLTQCVKESKLWAYVHFTWFVSDEQRDRYLAESQFVIVPSQKEWFGLVCLEANARHTPVLAYANPGLVDSVHDGVNGKLVEPNNIPALLDRIMYYHQNPKKYEMLVRSSYEHVTSLASRKDNALAMEQIFKK